MNVGCGHFLSRKKKEFSDVIVSKLKSDSKSIFRYNFCGEKMVKKMPPAHIRA
jgi:hypothetical protein